MPAHDIDIDVPPPPHAPPLLSPQALHQLCAQGYVGLDLPPPLAEQFEALKSAADQFFAQPRPTKDPYKPGGPRGPPTPATNTERGYTRLPGEKEFLTLRRSMTHVPQGPGCADAALRPTAMRVWHDTAHLLHRILADIGVYLGLAPWAFDAAVHDSLAPGLSKGQSPRDDPPTLLRLFRYELGGGGAERHRDLGLLTMCVCWGPGLQVKPPPLGGGGGSSNGSSLSSRPTSSHPDEGWIDAPRVTVMTGDTLYVLSGRRVPSAVHRVVVDPAEREKKTEDEEAKDEEESAPQSGRRSIVFALRATTAGELDLEPMGLPGSVNALELYSAIKTQRVNINQGKDTREAMRAKLRGQSGGSSNTTGVDDDGGQMQDEGDQKEERPDKKKEQSQAEPVGVA